MTSEAFEYLNQEDCTSARELARHIARRDWVLFAGSGISRRSGLPLWPDLVEGMIRRLGPEGIESKDPLEVASLFEANLGRSVLVDFLKENLQILEARPSLLHDCLLDLRPPVVVTTNFDDLLERALEQRGIPYALVIFDRELSLIGDHLPILKPHGDLKHPDALVFTRRDYARYPQQNSST